MPTTTTAAARIRPPGFVRVRWFVAAVVAATCVWACSDEPDHSIAGYCGQVQANIDSINAPTIATAADIAATLELYRAIGERAPAAVEPEWQVLIDSLETAATVVPGDAESVATANEVALSSQAAATRVQQYTQKNCGTDIGTPPAPTNPVTATTVSPPTTT
jgi:hypothetical protein